MDTTLLTIPAILLVWGIYEWVVRQKKRNTLPPIQSKEKTPWVTILWPFIAIGAVIYLTQNPELLEVLPANAGQDASTFVGKILSILFTLALAALALYIYFLPYITAKRRKHPSYDGIGILNFLLGWTVIFWIVALVWSLSGEDRSKMKQCVSCREYIDGLATICPRCQTENASMGI